jgi:hypothetical protein
MTVESPSNPSEDRVWATIQTTLRPEALRDFCRDLERLYRINPYSEFRMWKEMAPGQVHAEFRNLSNKQDYSLDLTLVPESDSVFSVRYSQGIKAATRFEIQPTGLGSNLTITDDYSTLPVEERPNAWTKSTRVCRPGVRQSLSFCVVTDAGAGLRHGAGTCAGCGCR